MGDIIRKMRHHVPETFLGNYVFLAAYMTVFSLYDGAAIEAVFLFTLRYVRQCKILFKNKYKKIQAPFSFTLLYKKITFAKVGSPKTEVGRLSFNVESLSGFRRQSSVF